MALCGTVSDIGLSTKAVAHTRRTVTKIAASTRLFKDIVGGSNACVSIMPNQNPAIVATMLSKDDCHCREGSRPALSNAISKLIPKIIKTLTNTILRQLQRHQERDDDTSRVVDRRTVLISDTTRRKASRIVHNALMMIAIGAPISSVAMTINILRMSVVFQVLTLLRSALLRPPAR